MNMEKIINHPRQFLSGFFWLFFFWFSFSVFSRTVGKAVAKLTPGTVFQLLVAELIHHLQL